MRLMSRGGGRAALASPMAKLYLTFYNTLQFLGWSFSLFRILWSLASTESTRATYASSGDLICFLQTISFLEVLHAALGLVPSGVVTSLLQWGGRTHFLLAIARQIPEVQELPSVFITFIAWCLSEIIRYSHYAFSGLRMLSSGLTYLRYSAFIILYPVGVGPGEMWLIYEALPFIRKRNLYSCFFSRIFITYYYFVTVLLICYPFLWLKLYLHMFKQRRSKLRGKHKTKNI